MELRKQLSLGLSVMPFAQDHYLGFSTGELTVLHKLTSLPNSTSVWEISGNLTGNRIATFPATSWGPDWLTPAGNLADSGPLYNATIRVSLPSATHFPLIIAQPP